MFVPPDYNRTAGEHPLKKIMVPHGMAEAKAGPDIFFQQRCPVNTCTIVRDNPDEADLILFKDYITHVGRRPHNQVRDATVDVISHLRYGEIGVAFDDWFCPCKASRIARTIHTKCFVELRIFIVTFGRSGCYTF